MTNDPVRQLHDRLAGVYDRRWKHYIAQTLTFLKNWACIPPLATVLDIGCGTGEFERLVLGENPEQRIVGLDLSSKLLEIARQKFHCYPNVTFCAASAASLPFTFCSFEIILSASSLKYLDQPEVCLR
jgi:ubiquinone/menaquinone biosynthesis C-methylase UbiE